MDQKIIERAEKYIETANVKDVVKFLQEIIKVAKELYKSNYPSIVFQETVYVLLEIEALEHIISVKTCKVENNRVLKDTTNVEFYRKEDAFIHEISKQILEKNKETTDCRYREEELIKEI